MKGKFGIALNNLKKCLECRLLLKGATQTCLDFVSSMTFLFQRLFGSDLAAFLWFLKEFYTKNNATILEIRSLPTTLPSSAFVPAIPASRLDSEWGNFMKEAMEKGCHLQRVCTIKSIIIVQKEMI